MGSIRRFAHITDPRARTPAFEVYGTEPVTDAFHTTAATSSS